MRGIFEGATQILTQATTQLSETAAQAISYIIPHTEDDDTKAQIYSFSPQQITSDEIVRFMNGTLYEEGFRQFVFNGFDFTNERNFNIYIHDEDICRLTHFHIQKLLKNPYIHLCYFNNATFTATQLAELLQTECDLSTASYQIREPIDFITYLEDFYEVCLQKNNFSALRFLPVKFENCTLTFAEDNILAVCKPISFKDTDISQAQAIKFIEAHSATSTIDLCHVSFANTEIDLLFTQYVNRLSFESECHQPGNILLKNISINNALLSVDTLAFCAIHTHFRHLFNDASLSFYLKTTTDEIFQIDIQTFLEKLSELKQLKTPRITAKPLTIFDNLYNNIQNDPAVKILEEISPLNFDTMSNGEKFLWVFYFLQYHSESWTGVCIDKVLRSFPCIQSNSPYRTNLAASPLPNP